MFYIVVLRSLMPPFEYPGYLLFHLWLAGVRLVAAAGVEVASDVGVGV